MIEARIIAKKMKHAVSVMRRVDDTAMFKIAAIGISCGTIDVASTMMGIVTLPSSAFDSYIAGEMRIGVDLDKLAGKVMRRAAAKDIIKISDDDDDECTWQFEHDIHQKTIGLLNPETIRKVPDLPELHHTTSLKLSGKIFKDIVVEAADVSNRVLMQATAKSMIIEAESNDTKTDRYKCLLQHAQYYERFETDTQCQYTLGYLKDVVADMKATDTVRFQFATDEPCEISYERDGVRVIFVIAPRIERS